MNNPTTLPAREPTTSALAEGIYLARQPILDRNEELHAFELLFRSSDSNGACIFDSAVATATVIQHLLNEFGLESVLGRYRGFINVDEAMILCDVIELLPKDRVVLEVLETVELNENIVKRLEHLKRVGFTLALDDVTALPAEVERVLEIVDIVKVDVLQLGAEELRALAAKLERRTVRLLAEKVDDREQAEACKAMGFDLFQGYYFAKPELITGKRLSPAEATIMRLLGMLMADAENAEIEALLKREPTMTMNLLRLTNSVGVGARSRITSVSSALMLLGRRQLLRWLQLALFAGKSASGRLPGPLMQLAATRGRMMELLSAAWQDAALPERAFMTGVMSLMEALLSTPIADILNPLPVAEDVRAALLERSGRLGALLDLVELVEGRLGSDCDSILQRLPPLTASTVAQAHLAALAWSNDIGR